MEDNRNTGQVNGRKEELKMSKCGTRGIQDKKCWQENRAVSTVGVKKAWTLSMATSKPLLGDAW